MIFNLTDIKEHLRIKGSSIKIKILIASGMEGEQYVRVSPTLLVSGYGSTEVEAKESFEHNMEVFCDDILALPTDKRDLYLTKLGFAKEKLNTKNFSKLYVDKGGILQGLEPSSVKTSLLEATV